MERFKPDTMAYVSAVPYAAERIHAAAIYCSDGRIGNQVDDFLQNGLRLPRYDRVACPGGPVGLAGRLSAYWELRGVEEQLGFLSRVHEIHRVVLIAHAECAYYSRRLALPHDRIEAEQRHDLEKAAWAVLRLMPGIDVGKYFARIRRTEIAFEPV